VDGFDMKKLAVLGLQHNLCEGHFIGLN